MIRKTKTIGLAVVAVLAMGAFVASSASASQFTAGAYPAVGHGVQEGTHEFEIGTKLLTCATATFSGTLAAASDDLTVTPTYETCHSVVLGATLDATVTMNGCTFTFTATAGEVHILCPAGKVIEIHVYSCKNCPTEHTLAKEACTYTIAPQTIKGVVYHNPTPEHVVVTVPGLGVAYTKDVGSELACGKASGTAKYTGNTKVTATSGGLPTTVDVK